MTSSTFINKAIFLDFARTLRPLPKAAGDLHRQAMSQLAGQHHNLSSVMAFVRDEIAENVPNIKGKVAPNIGRAGRNGSPSITAELQQVQNTRAAALQRWNEIPRFHLVAVDIPRHYNAVLFAQRLDPHTPGIVDMTGYHPDGATRSSGHRSFPELGGQMLDQKDCDAIVGFPRVKNGTSQIKCRRHATVLNAYL
jgi:hypothetical protein